ncbi:NAD-dependent epimerase/dehydratase family protein [Citricoccus muralis]|uniref:NAD-dependent epimerase/dehydratase family protein n=1 Tax=Citricoccus muralis TaxID=169134 RepID=A0ABY8H2W3_9MICC|nr:NAD-dependent epimerase/dehydratase family protein [Citricoccus muralis]WFP15472.1 NAD-dependent epimerase/dehydratase family protein [Citricoccus muralis]
MSSSPNHVLVTGASGVLGSGVAGALLAQGAGVTTLQRRPAQLDGAREVRGSVTDHDTVRQALTGVDTVVHLAAKVSVSGPGHEFEHVNVEGTRLLLNAARDAGVSRFVHISSPSVAHSGTSIIGDGAQPADPVHARGHYARTKAAGELLALDADAEDFRVLVLRPHLMWGPGDTQLTERIIDRSRSGRMPIIGSGAALVDTLYVANAVDAVLAATRAVDRHHGEALVVTNGEPRPIGELIRGLARAGGSPEPVLRVPAGLARVAGSVIERIWEAIPAESGDGEPPLTRFLAEQLSTAHWFDQRRTREVLDWTPRVSIDEGMRLTAEHYAG